MLPKILLALLLALGILVVTSNHASAHFDNHETGALENGDHKDHKSVIYYYPCYPTYTYCYPTYSYCYPTYTYCYPTYSYCYPTYSYCYPTYYHCR